VEITHNPWVVLETVSRDQIERVIVDPIFRKNVDGLIAASRQAAQTPAGCLEAGQFRLDAEMRICE